jgi:CRP-like cAMP-binding protein
MTAGDFARVAALPLFAGLTRAQLASLLRHAVVQKVPRGRVLFVQGDPASHFFVVLEGWVRLSRQRQDGGEVTIGLFTQAESFAEAAILAAGRYPVTGQAVEACRLLVVPGDDFMAQLQASNQLCLDMMAAMARRLHGFVQQLEQLSSRSSAERLALFLLRLCRVEQGSCTLELPLDKTLIAARLGMQPETLSRCLGRLRRIGVEGHGSQIVIADVAALRAFAQVEEV